MDRGGAIGRAGKVEELVETVGAVVGRELVVSLEEAPGMVELRLLVEDDDGDGGAITIRTGAASGKIGSTDIGGLGSGASIDDNDDEDDADDTGDGGSFGGGFDSSSSVLSGFGSSVKGSSFDSTICSSRFGADARSNSSIT